MVHVSSLSIFLCLFSFSLSRWRKKPEHYFCLCRNFYLLGIKYSENFRCYAKALWSCVCVWATFKTSNKCIWCSQTIRRQIIQQSSCFCQKMSRLCRDVLCILLLRFSYFCLPAHFILTELNHICGPMLNGGIFSSLPTVFNSSCIFAGSKKATTRALHIHCLHCVKFLFKLLLLLLRSFHAYFFPSSFINLLFAFLFRWDDN